MKLLGIESSCDETATAVVENGTRILSNLIASQVEIHARYGGVVPEVASREHLLKIVPLIQGALEKAQTSRAELHGVAVTTGPGLPGSLLVGVNASKALALAWGLPLTGVNHLEGHIYANWLGDKDTSQRPHFPLLCLIASGGHTDLVLMKGHGRYTLLGRTRDDAAGEAFDKVARLLGLGYPGGPAIEQAALQGDSKTYPLPRAWLRGNDDFSFSGLKTAVLHLARELGVVGLENKGGPLVPSPPPPLVADIAASFQEAVIEVLVAKTIDAAKRNGVRQILLAGGVTANSLLRERMSQLSPLPVLSPSPLLCTDNAAMIAACGYFRLRGGKVDSWDLDVTPNLKLGQIAS